MDKAIIKLQEALLHQGEDISRMQDEMYAQQKEIAKLAKEIERLKAKFAASSDESQIRRPEEETPPPHY